MAVSQLTIQDSCPLLGVFAKITKVRDYKGQIPITTHTSQVKTRLTVDRDSFTDFYHFPNLQ